MSHGSLVSSIVWCIRTAQYRSAHSFAIHRPSTLGLPNLRSFEMLSFANTRLSFYLFLLCLASLAASTPITYHRHHPDSRPFPYGKLADKLLNVNDISYMNDDLDDEDMVRVYPENRSIPFSSYLSPALRHQYRLKLYRMSTSFLSLIV